MISRAITKKIVAAKKSVLLLGPRQTGKSTLLNNLSPDLTINLARENEFLRYSSDIDLFSEQIESGNYKTVFIDEIQRIPGLLNTIQAIIDEKKTKQTIKFFLSGSSARKLRRGKANLLPGRIFSFELGGISAQEVDYKIDLLHAMKFGFLPEPFFSKQGTENQKLLESYASTYLKEEIQAEALARDIQGFARFLMTLAGASGQILDFSKLASKAKVARSSTIRFVEILEDTLIAQRVGSFGGADAADTVKHSKIYFFDVGVWNGLLQNFSTGDDRKGVLFEHLVYSQIRNSLMAQDLPVDIQYFRTRHGTEVDFIVKLRGKIWAIEAKAGDGDASDLKGLKAFREYFPQVDNCVLVTPKAKFRRKDNILICDWMALLREMSL